MEEKDADSTVFHLDDRVGDEAQALIAAFGGAERVEGQRGDVVGRCQGRVRVATGQGRRRRRGSRGRGQRWQVMVVTVVELGRAGLEEGGVAVGEGRGGEDEICS